jgi:hypothetical protein
MKNKKRQILTLAVITLATLAAIGIAFKTQRVAAFNPQPDPPGYGLVGITDVQTIRINVVNTNVPDPNLPPDPCRVVMTFKDTNGNPFFNGNGNQIRRIALVNAGESSFLVLNGANFRDPSGRLQLRPDVRVQQPDGTVGSPPDPCIPTVEVISNATSRTQFMLPAVQGAAAVAPR